MISALPKSVRYVKNGAGGRWWKNAKANGRIHLGWGNIPAEVLLSGDLAEIEVLVRAGIKDRRKATQDFNALRTALHRPSQHIWITFQDGCMWWCTAADQIEINPHGEDLTQGHFWLNCVEPWSNYSIGGADTGRHLAVANLPGDVTTTAGYQATICKPGGHRAILRILQNLEDQDAIVAREARDQYVLAMLRLVRRLRDKDFELLVDLILSRTGWSRLAKLGGAVEGIDVEVENPSTNEIAFVQVKSTADQQVLLDYVNRFSSRRDRYDRMIFAVHSPRGSLKTPDGEPVQVWTNERIADLVVRMGLGDWVSKRV